MKSFTLVGSGCQETHVYSKTKDKDYYFHPKEDTTYDEKYRLNPFGTYRVVDQDTKEVFEFQETIIDRTYSKPDELEDSFPLNTVNQTFSDVGYVQAMRFMYNSAVQDYQKQLVNDYTKNAKEYALYLSLNGLTEGNQDDSILYS